MHDPRDYLMTFLAAMEREIPPPGGQRHTLALSIENGEIRLALQVATRDKPRIIYIDEGDLSKPIPLLATECVSVLAATPQKPGRA